MDKIMSKCWKCGRLTFQAKTTERFVKKYYQGVWPETVPPPGSSICGRCHLPVINQVARRGGQLYHLIRSPKDLALILNILITIPLNPLDELLKDGLEFNPGSFHKSELISLVKGILSGTASEEDLQNWGKKQGGWGCGSEATTTFIVEKSMRILRYTPAWLATASRWDTGERDVYISTPLPGIKTESCYCVLRITAEWEIHGNSERGNLIVLPISKNRFLWFNGVEKWSRSLY